MPATEHGVACDEAGCVVALAGTAVTLAHGVEAAVEDCGRGDWSSPGPGRSVAGHGGDMLGPWALRESEGIAITRTGGGLTVQTVAASRGDWPWSRIVAENV